MEMVKAKVYNSSGGSTGEMELDSGLFDFDPKKYQVHQYVKTYLSNQRQGTHSTKTRAEVRGGGAKPWRQKGTGRARSGSNRSPVWEGGGTVFGPKPRSYYSNVPKRIKRNALLSMFSERVSEERLLIVQLPELDKPNTKTVFEFLQAIEVTGKRILILDENKDSLVPTSCRNIPKVEYKRACLVNAYDLAWAEYVLVTEGGMQSIKEVFAK
ncbi:MAG: 50S ribosomal protein L4 [candidate division Zixibacteria bacterium]|nr:50S ribosomal protein L4 [candidate division Zixibacteria bacterium]MBU1471450.1 50S ribosomal protein L4 [candidate division Zixibacteria bacterium]MBU2625634.1 50S ribosomal protein L4 [candidate division Zixibacteria bacterium]